MGIATRVIATVAIGLLFAATPASADPAPAPAPVPADLITSETSFRTADGLTLAATVYAPRGATGKLPAVLLVHGSGTGKAGYRKQLRGEAEAFAKQGMVVLAPDKREKDYTLFHRDFGQLADDALAAFAVLKDRPEVDPAKAGIWGLSEGGWVAPIAASRSTDIKFAILAAGPAMRPIRQSAWNVTNKLTYSGVGGSLTTSFALTWHRMISDAGMYGGAFHDPIPALSQVRQPVLAIWGTNDTAVPPAESAKLLRSTLAANGNTNLTIKFMPGAEHALHARGAQRERLQTLVPGYADAVGSWVRAVTSGQPTGESDGPPRQATETFDVSEPAWWESAPVQFGVLGLFLLVFAAYPLIALVRRIRGRGVPGTWSARVLATTGLLSSWGAIGYLSILMFSDSEFGIEVGPLLGDRPIVWLVLQALAVAATVATLLVARTVHSSMDRLRHGLLLVGGVLFIPWALYWGLLLP